MRIALLAMAVLLTGCQHAQEPLILSHKQVVVEPPADLYRCVQVRYPDSKNLTEAQVARLIVELHRANITCRSSIDAVREFIRKAKARVEG